MCELDAVIARSSVKKRSQQEVIGIVCRILYYWYYWIGLEVCTYVVPIGHNRICWGYPTLT
jgi:hypothetical protein